MNANRPEPSDSSSFEDALDSLWSVLVATSPRWVELDVAITDPEVGRWILYQLRSTPVRGGSIAGLLTPPAILSNLASLRIGGVRGVELGHFTPMVGPNWPSLRNLELNVKGSIYQVVSLLQGCSNLVSLALTQRHRPNGWMRPYSGEKVIHLPRLESIAFVGTLLAPNCHEMFDLPMLHSCALINVTHGGYPVREMEAPLAKWMERFGSQLTEFRISGTTSAFPSTWWIMGMIKDNLVPNLKRLILTGRTDYDALLLRLARLDANGSLYCPNLDTFISAPGGCGDTWMSEQSAFSFLRSLLGASVGPEGGGSVARLRYVRIGVKGMKEPYSDEELEMKGLELVKELRAKGVDLQGVTLKITYMIRASFAVGGPRRRVRRVEDADEVANHNANTRVLKVEVDTSRLWKTLIVNDGEVFIRPPPSPKERCAEVLPAAEEGGEEETEGSDDDCDGMEFALPYRTRLV